jgi:hypothetical protein
LGYSGLTGSGSNSLGLGNKSFTTNLDASVTAFAVGQYVRVYATSVPSQYMEGLITSFSGTSLTVNMTYVNGGASFSSWSITLSGAVGTSGYSGFSGISGQNGASGTSGWSGFSGSGISGYSGFSGATGPTVYPATGIAVSTGSAWDSSLVGTIVGQVPTWNGTQWVSQTSSSSDNSLLWYFMG